MREVYEWMNGEGRGLWMSLKVRGMGNDAINIALICFNSPQASLRN
jgi:hypothetical protein